MLETLIKNYAHCSWANNMLLECLKNYKVTDSKCINCMAHILAAEQIWISRLLGKSSIPNPVWPKWSLEYCLKIYAGNLDAWRNYLEGLSEQTLNMKLTYHNQSGRQFTQTSLEILQHVLFHGQYHRGQINSRLREIGIEPVSMDYILWLRMEAG